jgi:pimeloyl-ACP methyl ester carboxylesterase
VTALPATRFIDVNGIRLAYAEWPGRAGAQPILCLPHLTGHKGSFGPLAERLAPDWHVFALDLRGRGESDQPADGYGFAYHARDILAFADALSLPQFVLLGHSWGATTAAYLASIQPSRVRALVLLDGGADPKAESLRAMYSTIQRLEQRYPSLEAYLAAMRAISFFQPWSAALEQYFRDDVEVLPDGTLRSRSSAPAVTRDLDLHFVYSMCVHFPALRCPVLFLRPGQGLAGERGHVYSEAEAQAITANIPHCTRVDVPGVNHYSMLLSDEPPVAQPIREFLDGISAPIRKTLE